VCAYSLASRALAAVLNQNHKKGSKPRRLVGGGPEFKPEWPELAQHFALHAGGCCAGAELLVLA